MIEDWLDTRHSRRNKDPANFKYLTLIMNILDMEDTSATPYIMLLPLDISNMCIKMQCIIVALLTYGLRQENK
jgi:hypothetical protein